MSFGTLRSIVVLVIISISLFFFNKPLVFAQAAPSEDESENGVPPVESPVQAAFDDPITLAERALVLEEGAAGTDSVAAPSSVGTVLRMILTLAVAAAAIYGVIFFIKRASRRAEIRDPFLKILASTHLGSNRYAHVVSVGARAWLLGASEGGVNLISEIEDKDILNALFLEDSRKSAEVQAGTGRFIDFKALLRRLGMPAASGTPGAENIRKRRERLKGL